MYVKISPIFAVLLGCLLFSVLGCEPDRTTSPILPGEIAVLRVTFDPYPVYEGYSNKYHFTVFIDEVNGVGARITSMKVDDADKDGNILYTDQYDEHDVVQTFGTSRIEAFGRLMTRVDLEACFDCTRENWLVRADDDRGNHVEYSGNVELIAR